MTKPISASSVAEFQVCKRRWGYTDTHWGLGYEQPGKQEKLPILVGNLVHYALHIHRQHKLGMFECLSVAINKVVSPTVAKGSPAFLEALSLTEAMLGGYQTMWADNPDHSLSDMHLDFLVSEYRFEFDAGSYVYRGTWDGAARHKKTGELWVFETKTTNNVSRLIEGVHADFQPRLYVAALEHFTGEKVAGIIYDVIKRADPYNIKLLKSGLPSKARDTLDGTTFNIYLKTLQQCAVNEAHYHELISAYQEPLDYLKYNSEGLYHRFEVRLSPAQKTETIKYLTVKGKQMEQAVQDSYPPDWSRYTCGYCPFKFVCQLQSDGGDWQQALQSAFILADARPEPTVLNVSFMDEGE